MLITPSLSPNISKEDVHLAIALLLQPWKWRDTEPVHELESVFSDILSISKESVFAINSARAGIADILSTYSIGKGDEVIVQGFTCVAVTNPVHWVGATPVIVDIEKDSLNVSLEEVKKHVSKKTKAIIVQHTFGLPFQDLDELLSFAHEKGIIVIEDCAHALGATRDGKPVGTIADASVFSFGRDKIVSSVFGGIVVLKDFGKQNKYRQQVETRKKMGWWWIKKQLLHPITTWISLVTYHWLSFGKAWHYVLQNIGLISKATSFDEKMSGPRPLWTTKKMPGVLAKLAMSQLSYLKVSTNRRTEIASKYYDAGIQSVQIDTAERVWLRYAILENSPTEMKKYFSRRGVILGDWYDQVVAPCEVDLSKLGYTVGDAPVAEDVASQVVNLPTYSRMTDEDVSLVISLYKEYKEEKGA